MGNYSHNSKGLAKILRFENIETVIAGSVLLPTGD